MGAGVDVVAARAAVTAAVLAEYAGRLDGVCAVSVRETCNLSDPGVSFQMWDAHPMRSVEQLARAALALGMAEVRLEPSSASVRVVAVAEVSTAAGTALVELWDYLYEAAIGQVAALLGVELCPDTDPVYVTATHLLRVVETAVSA
ncbi:hypothetical protein [Saccharothrix sp. NRRL B-16314]|uniref:hypothetical protein n=1 Tax=Saccharothrix sp. NRRL B-16314 TaxID=1463825 RepID=UPI000525272A|nr:hypothetical protein [Saccharothrix sp. NRRL B-16314]